MNWFKNLSIKSKLLSLSVISAGIALGISCAGFISADMRVLYEAKKSQLKAQAEMLGFNAGMVLSTQDVHSAEQLLAPLKYQTSLAAAALYAEQGEKLATFTADGNVDASRQSLPVSGFGQSQKGAVELLYDVEEGGQIVGRIFLRADMRDYWQQRNSFLITASLVLLVSMVATAILSSWLQKPISNPIRELASAAQHISQHGDLSVRVNYEARDELGTLFSAFNGMLGRVQETETALLAEQEHLEHRVRERTVQLELQIAERERIQADLVKACFEAESSNRAKSEFLANMSHEIRTPMTAIIGFSEILTNEYSSNRSAEEKNAVETIRRNGEHLLGIINDILDLSKIEAGKMEMEQIVCCPQQLVQDVATLMSVRSKAKEIDLLVEYANPIPETFISDPIRVRQILINLIGNAIKFTKQGSVKIRVSFNSNATEPRLEFEVIDTGIGISPDQISKLFQSFAQADTSTTRLYGGTGLGLTIGRKMSNLLGGEIDVKSTPQVGSTFRLCLPTGSLENVKMLTVSAEHERKLEAKPTVTPQQIRFDGLKVLVAEDGLDNQKLIRFLLKKLGITATMVENGQLAVDAAIEARAAGEPFQLILSDMQMPVLDGYRAATKMRELGFKTPIIALTAHAMSSDRDLCIAAGCDDYMTKPLDFNTLVSLIKKQLDRTSALPISMSPISLTVQTFTASI